MRAHRTYSAEEKATAVGRSLAVGAKTAGRELGIPQRTIDGWKSSPAFAELRSRAREDVADEMWAGVQIAISEVVDGLTNPRTPLRDKAKALEVLYDRYALLTGSATARTESRDITGTLSDTDIRDALREAKRLVAGEGADRTPAGTPAG